MQFEPISLGYNSFTLNYELNGCSVEDSIDIFVNPIPLVNVFGDAICAGDTALIGASAIPSGGVFVWYDGSSSVGSGDTLFLTPTDTTQYNVQYTSLQGCSNDTSTTTVYAFEVPVITSVSNYSICPTDTISIEALVSVPGGNSAWTNDQNTDVGLNNPLIVSPDDTTLYTLEYVVDYGFGVSCSDTAQVLVNVFEAPVIDSITTSICSDIAFDISS